MRCFMERFFKLSASADSIVNGFRLKLMYIYLILSIRSSLNHLLWFSAACAAAIDHRNHFFCLFQQNKCSESKITFRQVSNCCKKGS